MDPDDSRPSDPTPLPIEHSHRLRFARFEFRHKPFARTATATFKARGRALAVRGTVTVEKRFFVPLLAVACVFMGTVLAPYLKPNIGSPAATSCDLRTADILIKYGADWKALDEKQTPHDKETIDKQATLERGLADQKVAFEKTLADKQAAHDKEIAALRAEARQQLGYAMQTCKAQINNAIAKEEQKAQEDKKAAVSAAKVNFLLTVAEKHPELLTASALRDAFRNATVNEL